MSNCPIYTSTLQFAFNAKILKKYEISYWQCPKCELLKTEKPYWFDEAYQNAIIDGDTGLIQRNNSIVKKLSGILYFLFNKNAAYLDVAGGCGMLTRLMRDYGFHFYWTDPYCQNILARGFEVEKVQKKFEALTAFEVLEHIESPVEFLKNLIEKTIVKILSFQQNFIKVVFLINHGGITCLMMGSIFLFTQLKHCKILQTSLICTFRLITASTVFPAIH